mmetsp:Transcript_121462/g.388506  ORF Transcript_121462/g.388506 Transcript_121462/m.388506 type:complete len:219 (-) Transcript_121462:2676-3332(-)
MLGHVSMETPAEPSRQPPASLVPLYTFMMSPTTTISMTAQSPTEMAVMTFRAESSPSPTKGERSASCGSSSGGTKARRGTARTPDLVCSRRRCSQREAAKFGVKDTCSSTLSCGATVNGLQSWISKPNPEQPGTPLMSKDLTSTGSSQSFRAVKLLATATRCFGAKSSSRARPPPRSEAVRLKSRAPSLKTSRPEPPTPLSRTGCSIVRLLRTYNVVL